MAAWASAPPGGPVADAWLRAPQRLPQPAPVVTRAGSLVFNRARCCARPGATGLSRRARLEPGSNAPCVQEQALGTPSWPAPPASALSQGNEGHGLCGRAAIPRGVDPRASHTGCLSPAVLCRLTEHQPRGPPPLIRISAHLLT